MIARRHFLRSRFYLCIYQDFCQPKEQPPITLTTYTYVCMLTCSACLTILTRCSIGPPFSGKGRGDGWQFIFCVDGKSTACHIYIGTKEGWVCQGRDNQHRQPIHLYYITILSYLREDLAFFYRLYIAFCPPFSHLLIG